MRPYPAYKDSGVDWLGAVPEGWEISTLKHIVSTPITDGPHETPAFLDEGVPFVSAEAVSSGKINFDSIRGHISPEDHARYSLKYAPKRNDIFMIKSGATTGVTAIVETDVDFNIWSPLAAVRCGSSVHPYFVLNFMRSQNFFEAVKLGWNFGTQQNIGMGVIENLNICIPPLSEQQAIARFLDKEVAKIDALVAEQRRLIALLAEKRQAVISHAVTKGLNPATPLKPSGIDWLGDIPEGWEVVHLRRAFRSTDYGISDSLEPDGQVAVLRMGNISDGRVWLHDLKFIDSVPDDLFVEPGDLLFNRTNSLELIGKVGLYLGGSELPVSFASYLVRLRLETGHLPTYFAYLLNTPMILGEARSRALVAIGQCNLNPSRYSEIRVPIPPPEEQDRIVAYLDAQTAQFDALTAAATSAISLLQERRAALISAAVTGKIDLRPHFAQSLSEPETA